MWDRQNGSIKQRYFSTQLSKRRSIPYELSKCVLLFHGRRLRISPFDPEDVAKSIHPAVRDPVFTSYRAALFSLIRVGKSLIYLKALEHFFYRFHST